MALRWNHVPTWVDWAVAALAAVIALNVNVTSSGDPLSGIGEVSRATFYGVLVLGGIVLASVGLVLGTIGAQAVGGLVARTYSLVAFAGVLGLLLDYRDGPVRTVQLVIYLMLFLGVVRLVRITVSLTAESDGKAASADPLEALDRNTSG